MTPFNEDSRVKIPALLHLARLGYTYISLKQAQWDARNNIFPELFEEAVLNINPELRREDVPALLSELQLKLAGDDIGRGFHQRLTARAGVRLIDFDNPCRWQTGRTGVGKPLNVLVHEHVGAIGSRRANTSSLIRSSQVRIK